jgi:hypothetical protein
LTVPILLQHQNSTRSQRLGQRPPAPHEFSRLVAAREIKKVDDHERIPKGLIFDEFTYALELNFLEAAETGESDDIANALRLLEVACAFQLTGSLRRRTDGESHISLRLLDLLANVYTWSSKQDKLDELALRGINCLSNKKIELSDLARQRLLGRVNGWDDERQGDRLKRGSEWTFYGAQKKDLKVDLADVRV